MSDLEFAMPDVGEGLHEAEIVEWLVAVGDAVHEDQPVVVMQTDKAVVDIPAPASGVLLAHGGAVGDTVLVGSLLFRLGLAVPSRPVPSRPVPSAPAPSAPALTTAAPVEGGAHQRPKASPATRRRALDLGVTLADVAGTGPGGRITSADVEGAADAPPAPSVVLPRPERRTPQQQPQPQPQPQRVRLTHDDVVEPLRGTRRQIARTMTESWTTIPHVTELREIDATQLVRAHRALRARAEAIGVRLTYLPLFVAATVAALRDHPNLNASLDMASEQIITRGRCNIGIAMATDEGLVVPVIHDADQLTIVEIARRIEQLTEAARTRSLTLADSSHGTFTISNYGSYGTWMGTPIIRPPEAGVAGFGRIRDAVVAVDGQAVVRTMLPIAVSADHRVNDGHHLGAFVSTLEELLVDPVLLLAGGQQWS